MPGATCCKDCGQPDAQPVMEDIYAEDAWAGDVLYLCRGCADRREGVPTMDEQTMPCDGEGRR